MAPSAIVGAIVEIIVSATSGALVGVGVAITLTTKHPVQVHRKREGLRYWTPQRLNRHALLLPQDQSVRPLPRQLATRAYKKHPIRNCTVRMCWTCHLVHCPQNKTSRCSEPVGGTDTGRLADEVDQLAPSIAAPGETGDRRPSDPSRSAAPYFLPTRGF